MIDLLLFGERSIDRVVKSVYVTVQKPILPPFWSLGYHLCRWGYRKFSIFSIVFCVETLRKFQRSSDDVIEIVDKMSAAEIPLEVQWVDIDYMIDQRDFTVDPVKWGSMKNLTEKLHQNGQKFVLILDPAIPAEAGDDYLPAVTGIYFLTF